MREDPACWRRCNMRRWLRAIMHCALELQQGGSHSGRRATGALCILCWRDACSSWPPGGDVADSARAVAVGTHVWYCGTVAPRPAPAAPCTVRTRKLNIICGLFTLLAHVALAITSPPRPRKARRSGVLFRGCGHFELRGRAPVTGIALHNELGCQRNVLRALDARGGAARGPLQATTVRHPHGRSQSGARRLERPRGTTARHNARRVALRCIRACTSASRLHAVATLVPHRSPQGLHGELATRPARLPPDRYTNIAQFLAGAFTECGRGVAGLSRLRYHRGRVGVRLR